MRVVDIAARRKSRVAITLSPLPEAKLFGAEYEGEKILIDKVIAARCDITLGCELSDEDLKQLVYVSECYRAKERAVWLLSGQDYSEKALYQKLIKSYTKKAAAFAVSQMVKKGFVNDERFAAALVSRCRAKNMSKRQILQKLAQNGISAEISSLLVKQNEDIANTENLRAAELIKSKYLNKITSEEGRKKTFSALMRRGFSVSDIKKAFELVAGSNCFEEEIF